MRWRRSTYHIHKDDNFFKIYSAAAGELREAMIRYIKDEENKYFIHLISASGPVSIAAIVHVLNIAIETHSLSYDSINHLVPGMSRENYRQFIDALRENDLITFNFTNNTYTIESRIGLFLSTPLSEARKGLHKPFKLSVALRLSNPETVDVGAATPATPPFESKRTLASRIIGRILGRHRSIEEPIGTQTLALGKRIDQTTSSLDNIYNLLGPPPESSNQTVDFPWPTPAGAP